MTSIYSILHLLVDGVCAFAMFGRFALTEQGYWNILIYNFCAFALQMPFGTILDLFAFKQKNVSCMCAIMGSLVTMIGAFTNPVILGIGNALFHVGGGVDVIYEEHRKHWKGAALGIFVAPGALGLFIGTQLAGNIKESIYNETLILAGLIMCGFICLLFRMSTKDKEKISHQTAEKISLRTIILVLCSFLVVILRSYIGMAVNFSWKTNLFMGFISVLMVVLGKMAGGILAAKTEIKKVVMISLLLSAAGYFFGQNVFGGMSALFFFNMTMPITLYLLVCELKELPGFSFGLLTFGLFLGFLPVYFQMEVPISDNVLGAAGSILSLLILRIAVTMEGGEKDGTISD